MALPEGKCCLSKRVVILSLALYHLRLGTTQVRSVRMSTNDAWVSHVVSSGIGVFVLC